jgi:hypothetical protein
VEKLARSFFALALLTVVPSLEASWFDQTRSNGEVAFETRVFDNDNNKETNDFGLAVFSRVEARYDDSFNSHVFRAMARYDRQDNGRNFMTIEDAYLSTRYGDRGQVRLLAGYKIFNWTATEAFHPADQINSRNLDGEFENLEKIGELTVELEVPFWLGTMNFYFFPRFEEPKLPSPNSRLGGIGVAVERPAYIRGSQVKEGEVWTPQFGLSTLQSFSFGDVSLHAIRHINRSYPLGGSARYGNQDVTIDTGFGDIVVPVFGPPDSRLTPYFLETTQIGGTAELMFPVITKIEWAYRFINQKHPILDLSQAPDQLIDGFSEDALTTQKDHAEVAIGFEYAYDHESGAESMLLLEATSFFGLKKEERRRRSLFHRHAFVGWRFSLNDILGKEFLLSSIIDIEDPQQRMYNASYSQRLTDAWRIRSAIRVFEAPKPERPRDASGFQFLRRSDSFTLSLTRYF